MGKNQGARRSPKIWVLPRLAGWTIRSRLWERRTNTFLDTCPAAPRDLGESRWVCCARTAFEAPPWLLHGFGAEGKHPCAPNASTPSAYHQMCRCRPVHRSHVASVGPCLVDPLCSSSGALHSFSSLPGLDVNNKTLGDDAYEHMGDKSKQYPSGGGNAIKAQSVCWPLCGRYCVVLSQRIRW